MKVWRLVVGPAVGLMMCASVVAYAQDDSDATSVPAPEGAEEPAVDAEFNRKLLTVEEEVNTLKERVFRAKATLQLLREIVVQGASTGSRATVWHVNRLGNAYTMESVAYFLDGQGKFSKVDPTGGLDASKEFKIFDGAIPPGNHNLTVNLKLRGSGYGIFNYVQNYNFNVQSSTVFVAEEGKNCQVRVVTGERKGIGRSFTERPNITFETRCVRLVEEEGGEGQ
ncbi:MAG: dihydrolipoamide acetyltransferase [Myxococcota bacterium]|nr:dihydrolipoamide acetyltransferase [Myxococcota bacterium]